MTERLTQLMRDEADHLDVPTPAAAAVLAEGRRVRRRRTLATTAAGIAATVVVATTATLALTGGSGDRATDPVPAAPAADAGAAFAVGPVVYTDDGAQATTIDDTVVKSLYYTSAGVLVRSGDNSMSDGGGPQRFSLVTPDGVETPVSVMTEETVPGVDATQPYLAYAEVVDGTVEVVVHNVSTDEEVARWPVPDIDFTGGWAAPPVALSGDLVYVGSDTLMRTVDWRTGEVTERPDLPPAYPNVSGGRIADSDGADRTVVDAATGEELLRVTVPADSYGYFDLSPDGRYATLFLESATEPEGTAPGEVKVYDVDTGTSVDLPADTDPFSLGWSAAGEPFSVSEDGSTLTTCSSENGACTDAPLELTTAPGQDDPVRLILGGRTYES